MLIVLDKTGWDQEQKNLIQAMSVSILFQNGIKYDSLSVDKDYNVWIDNPSSDPAPILTTDTVSMAYGQWKVDNDAKSAAAKVELEARDQEKDTSIFNGVKIDDINAHIDAISTLDDIKSYIKDFVRYCISRGL